MSEPKPSNNTIGTPLVPPSRPVAGATEIKKPSVVANVISLQSSPFTKGYVSAINMGANSNAAILLHNLIPAVMQSESFYGYPGVSVETVSVICADKNSSQMLRSQYPVAVTSGKLEVIDSLTASPSNYFQQEGRSLVAYGVKEKREVLILVLSAPEGKSKLPVKELPALIAQARARGHAVVIVFQGLAKDDAQRLPDYFNAVFSVEPCEPDFGYTSAWIVAPAPGSLLAAIGKRPMIDNIRANADGLIERISYECASSDAMTREIVKQLDLGKNYTQIAKMLGVNKTTVMRRFDALPFNPNRRGNLDE